jgi:GNAT superfamily N-acetyltransferase
MITLRPADPSEADVLTDLCLRSKAVWGYDATFMAKCRAELTLTAADIAAHAIMVAERDGTVVGMAQVALHGASAEIDKLFVDPTVLRSGAGRALYDWCIETARKAGAKLITMDADPDAAPFYRRMGALDDGVTPSGSIAGRFLPRLKVVL